VLGPNGFLSAVGEGFEVLCVLLCCGESAVQELPREVGAGEL